MGIPLGIGVDRGLNGKPPKRAMVRLWDPTRKLLKIIAADRDQHMTEVMHEIVLAEYERYRQKQESDKIKDKE